MANLFFPGQDGNFLDWDYVTYFGDGIPLLFWVFAYPYDNCLNALGGSVKANEYRWAIYNEAKGKTTRFNSANTLQGAANSFLQFPTNTAYSSRVLYNLTRNSTQIGPYNNKHAVIVIDSPWARSCISRDPTSESKKNENYAVGLSLDMGNRIARTYPNWSQWWNNICSSCGCLGNDSLSLLPGYLKSALLQARGNFADSFLGGIESLDILMFNPSFNNEYSPSEEQPGLLLPEIGMAETKILATQCAVDQYSWQVNPFGKAFVGAFVAIYKDYSEYNTAVVNNLLINVPWSGALTGVQQYKMNATLPSPQCSLSCPSHIDFNSNGTLANCSIGNPNLPGIYIDPFDWQTNGYPAPYTIPRIGCKGGGTTADPCYPNIFPYDQDLVNSVWALDPDLGGLDLTAGDGFRTALGCDYPSYNIGIPDFPTYYDFFNRPGGPQIPFITAAVGPWKVEYSFLASRTYAAGGGCESAAFQPFDL